MFYLVFTSKLLMQRVDSLVSINNIVSNRLQLRPMYFYRNNNLLSLPLIYGTISIISWLCTEF